MELIPEISAQTITNSKNISNLVRGQDTVAEVVTDHENRVRFLETAVTSASLFQVWARQQFIAGRGLKRDLDFNRNQLEVFVDPNELRGQVLLAGDNIAFRVKRIGGVDRLEISATVGGGSSGGT